MEKLVYLSLGSNVGDRSGKPAGGDRTPRGARKVISTSSPYETEPVEVTGHPWYLNCAIALRTEKMPKQLIGALLGIEQEMGRRRSQREDAAQD